MKFALCCALYLCSPALAVVSAQGIVSDGQHALDEFRRTTFGIYASAIFTRHRVPDLDGMNKAVLPEQQRATGILHDESGAGVSIGLLLAMGLGEAGNPWSEIQLGLAYIVSNLTVSTQTCCRGEPGVRVVEAAELSYNLVALDLAYRVFFPATRFGLEAGVLLALQPAESIIRRELVESDTFQTESVEILGIPEHNSLQTFLLFGASYFFDFSRISIKPFARFNAPLSTISSAFQWKVSRFEAGCAVVLR